MPVPEFSIVIPHYNQPDLLRRTLQSICEDQQTGDQPPPRIEVIVVDNGSDEMPLAACAGFDGVRLLLETEKGPGPARNRGAAAARGETILFIDSDCLAEPDWLLSTRRALARNPDSGILCGDVAILPEQPGRMTAIEAYEELFAYRSELMVRRFRFAPTCNLAVRRQVFEAVGPFIPGLLISEDVEWGRRAHDLGHPIRFEPSMRILTPARENFAEVARRWDRQVGQQHAEMMRLPGGRLRWGLKTLAMPFSPLAEIRGVFSSPRLPGLRERRLAFGCLVQTRFYRSWRMVQLMTGAVDNEWLAGAWRRSPGT